MQTPELCFARTGNLKVHPQKHDNDDILLVDSPEPSNQQSASSTSSSSSDDEDEKGDEVDSTQYEEEIEDAMDGRKSEVQLNNKDVYVEVNVIESSKIYMPMTSVITFLEQLPPSKRSFPIT